MVYIDLDGVLADLSGWITKIDPKGLSEQEVFFRIARDYNREIFLDSEAIRFNFRLLYGDYRILSALPNEPEFIRYGIKAGYNPVELSKMFLRFYRNKMLWCREHGIPESRIILVPTRKHKFMYCRCADLLYDDDPDTIAEWNKSGGVGVLVESKEYTGA